MRHLIVVSRKGGCVAEVFLAFWLPRVSCQNALCRGSHQVRIVHKKFIKYIFLCAQ